MANGEPPKLLFIYETANNDDVGVYTAYHNDKERLADWSHWLEHRYFPPHIFVNRFGYSPVWAGPLRDEEHLQELLQKIGIDD